MAAPGPGTPPRQCYKLSNTNIWILIVAWLIQLSGLSHQSGTFIYTRAAELQEFFSFFLVADIWLKRFIVWSIDPCIVLTCSIILLLSLLYQTMIIKLVKLHCQFQLLLKILTFQVRVVSKKKVFARMMRWRDDMRTRMNDGELSTQHLHMTNLQNVALFLYRWECEFINFRKITL